MVIGLIDVDGHNFPNLALMRISSYWKSQGAKVEWHSQLNGHYDKVYMSKVFSFSRDYDYYIDADEIYRGGSGYAIELVNGREVYHKELDADLPQEIEQCSPDYTIYPQYDYAVAQTTRGCPRGCPFCIVASKEGRCSRKVADVSQFWQGQKHIEVIDPNITACKERFELYQQYIDTGASITFNQGLDIRLITDKDIDYLNKMKSVDIHFAWDNPKDDLIDLFADFKNRFKYKSLPTVYCLTNFNSTMDENLYRINELWKLGYYPYVMVYDKKHAPKEIKQLQRWCNNRFIFKSCSFEDYRRGR